MTKTQGYEATDTTRGTAVALKAIGSWTWGDPTARPTDICDDDLGRVSPDFTTPPVGDTRGQNARRVAAGARSQEPWNGVQYFVCLAESQY
ncbi:hypothetical protein MKZ38_008494 [Zalerion maritima]|uniref:Uncharacterized protein n=1 Tax=Zalerion maritima TaxID=339359 RepID=A0AAD5RKT4_9PEZI|nr:hypothetical protein MKZ38_008494 [Zalerion maritima]